MGCSVAHLCYWLLKKEKSDLREQNAITPTHAGRGDKASPPCVTKRHGCQVSRSHEAVLAKSVSRLLQIELYTVLLQK